MEIGIVGTGHMGNAVARFLGRTNRVALADRDPAKAAAAVTQIGAGDGVTAASIAAALSADMVVLALWYPVTTEFAREHAAELQDKIVIDISNPLDETYVGLRTDLRDSGAVSAPSTSSAELLAQALPGSRIVKAFNTTPSVVLAEGQIDDVPLDVFVAGDDDTAKSSVSELVRAAGLRPVDVGRLKNARVLEGLAALEGELSQRYGLGFRVAFKVLPAAFQTA